jgi:hypothetical protein
MPVPSIQLPPSSLSSSGRTLAQVRELLTSAHASAFRPANVWSDPTLPTLDAGAAMGSTEVYDLTEACAALDVLGCTL